MTSAAISGDRTNERAGPPKRPATPAPDELDLDYIFGYFHQAYDTDFDKIHKRYLAGEITIEQHVKLSEKSWHKHLAKAKSQILAYVDKRERRLLSALLKVHPDGRWKVIQDRLSALEGEQNASNN